MTADIGDDRLVHLVSADAHRARIDDAAKGEHRNFRRAAADIDDHGARRLRYGKPGADCGSHRLLDEIDAARASRERRFLNRATFDRRRSGRHANDDLRIGKGAAVMHLADEVLDHFFRDFEVGDDAVAHGPDRLDVAGRAAEHHLSFLADGKNLLLAAFFDDGDNRRLVQHDPPPLRHGRRADRGVRRAEIDCHIGREHAEQTGKHAYSIPLTERCRKRRAFWPQLRMHHLWWLFC